jgi:tyrosine phenol-lyase
MVEPLPITTRAQRQQALHEAGYNISLLHARDVYTDSGSNAMSDQQCAAMMTGDEAFAGSSDFYRLQAAVRQYYGYEHLIFTHRGRGAENYLFRILIRPGHVPGNMCCTTTRAHQELNGATFLDVIIHGAHDPACERPFKGNLDLAKLERLIRDVGPHNIPYVSVTATVKMAGGQPISLANLTQVTDLAHRHGIIGDCKSFGVTPDHGGCIDDQ